ncbi:SH3 domain-containing protein [Alkalihalobacillus clausii]|nr:SH3 domain-containing protein [Shouchella clausii]MBX0307372.1 SH3 domain-containing protein [Shouchella clausii]
MEVFPIQKKLMLAGSSASIVALVASALPLQSAYASSITVKETHYNSSFDAVVDRQMGLSARPQTDKNGRWENASRSDVAYYMNANNFKQGTSSYLQFLNLSSSAGLSAGTINSQLLSDKGILQGQGQAFINASKLYGVNEIYLISHALLETGNGKSQLATGVQVNGKTVYNMYGIGAYDGNAVSAGAQYAYNQGWFTPEDAIIGGARFVSSNYFARGQNTLYKMRWNPANPGTYQYATDVGWAVKQTHHMSNLYSLVDDYEMTFDVPVYKNQPTGDAGNDKLEQLPTGTFGTTTARLNVRTGPGTSHSIVTTLDKDTKVELLAKQGNWYQIAVDNTTGFVSGDYLKLDKPSEDNVEDSDQELISYGETTARLNLRSQPNTSSNVLTTLALGQKLEILKKEGNWYRVRAGHQSGWVSADYVKISSNGVDKESPSLGSATTTARLNLRSGAGTNHSIITTLTKGQKVELLKKQGGWYQVKAGNRTGWVSADYLNVNGSGNVDNAPSSGSATTTARLNLRSGAGTNHSIITTLAKGQKVELLKKQGGWYQVKAGNRTGWVSVDYLNVSGSGNVDNTPSNGSATTTARLNLRSGAGTNHSIITTLAKGQKVELLKKQGGWYQVKAGNRTGWVSVDYLNVSGSGNVDNAPSNGSATTTARLNLRSGAGTNHSIITTLAKGQKVELLKKQGGWYQVKAGNRTGWVSADYLNVSNNQAKTESVETVIDRGTTTARLNLRVDPNTSSKIITTLNNGQQLDILKKQGSWYYVKVGSQTGWVSSQYVKLTEAKPTVQVMARTFSFAPIAPEVETNEEANESVNEENDVADLENSPSEKQQPIDEVEKEEDKQDVSPDKERDTDEHAEEPSIDENDTVPHSDEANDQTVEEDDHVADENEQASETTDTENDAENEESNLPASEEAPSEENDSTDESSLEEPQEPETDPSTDEQEPETDASADEQEPETDANTDEQEPETDASTDEQEPETDANTDEQEPETDASADEQDLAEQVAEEEHGDADGTSEDQESPVSDTAENNEADENSEPVQEEETDVADDEAEALPEEAEGPSEQDEEPSEATEEQQTTVGQKIQLTENTLLFSEASSDSEQLLELFEDDTIEILEEGTDFVKVKANGVEGWIAVEALAAVLP